MLEGMKIIIFQSYISLGQFVCHSKLLSHMCHCFVLTLMSKCFHKFQEFSLTHVIFFCRVLKLQQYPFEPKFGICDLVTIIAWIIMRVKKFGCIKYWEHWKAIIQSMNNFLHIRCTQ